MLPINPSKIPQIYAQALGLQKKGKPREALGLYRTILNANPKVAEAHFQVGQIMLRAADFRAATDAFAKAAALKPRESAIWRGYGEALLKLDDDNATSAALRTLEASGLPDKARAEIRDRLSRRNTATRVATGGVAPAALKAVVDSLNAGDAATAEKKVRALLRQQPDVAVLHNMLATTRKLQGDPAGADTALRRAIALDPDYAEAIAALGQLLLERGDHDAAIQQLERARSLTPRSPATLTALARAYNAAERTTLARDLLDRAIRLDRKSAEPLRLRAQINAKTGDHDAALADLDAALSLGLTTGQVHHARARALAQLGRAGDALAAVDTAIAGDSENPEFYATKATFQQSGGDFDAAEETFRAAFGIDPTNGSVYRTLSASHKFTEGDPLLAQMEATWARDDLSDLDRMQLGFALSKAMEDIKAHDRVFGYLNTSNQLMRAMHPYSISQRRQEIDRVKKVFDGFDPDDHPLTGDSDFAPIFVTGMPRSGTTLVEQILASHSTVTGAGETGRFARQGYGLLLPVSGDRMIGQVRQGEIDALADDYRNYIETLLPGAGRITDKSIQTYLLMGLVWLALPRARVIVVRRDPRDNLLSIYKNVFPAGTHLYSYDLHDLGRYYRMFVEMIDFWRAIAPDRFHEIWYDDLIADPNGQSRALVDAAGLDWEDACLNFHQNTRKVDTLSVYQVRQPIYRTSLKAWQRYEDELAPLFDSLGDAVERG